MAGFFHERSEEFDGATMLEIGAGTGLCGIVAARIARRVFVTGVVQHLDPLKNFCSVGLKEWFLFC